MSDMELFDKWTVTEDKDEYVTLAMKVFKIDEAKALKMWEDEQKELRSNQYDDHKSDYRSTMRVEKQFIVNISQRGNELYWIAEFPNNF